MVANLRYLTRKAKNSKFCPKFLRTFWRKSGQDPVDSGVAMFIKGFVSTRDFRNVIQGEKIKKHGQYGDRTRDIRVISTTL